MIGALHCHALMVGLTVRYVLVSLVVQTGQVKRSSKLGQLRPRVGQPGDEGWSQPWLQCSQYQNLALTGGPAPGCRVSTR
jgi:hypothetical protein